MLTVHELFLINEAAIKLQLLIFLDQSHQFLFQAIIISQMVKIPTSLILIFLIFALTSCLAIKNAVPYNVNESTNYAYMAGLAYCPKSCLENWSCKQGKQFDMLEVAYINNEITLASCFIGYYRTTNQILISFRGSANIQNVIEDINVQMVPYDCKGCAVHAGFLEDYRLIEAKVDAKVADLLQKYPTARILATGHSLGGALSEIGGLRLRQKFGAPVDVHNFGCPRIGNSAMAQFVVTRLDSLYRVVHYKDIVPHFPSQLYLYHHSPFQVFFDESMTSFVICSESGEDRKCSNQYAPDYNLLDHQLYFVKVRYFEC